MIQPVISREVNRKEKHHKRFEDKLIVLNHTMKSQTNRYEEKLTLSKSVPGVVMRSSQAKIKGSSL